MSRDRGKELGTKLGAEIPAGPRETEDLDENGDGGEDRGDEIVQPCSQPPKGEGDLRLFGEFVLELTRLPDLEILQCLAEKDR